MAPLALHLKRLPQRSPREWTPERKRATLTRAPTGYDHVETPTQAAGQSTSKSPNTRTTGRIPGSPPSTSGAQHSLGAGTRDSWCHSPRLQVRHFPESGPRSPASVRAPSRRSRHRCLALESSRAHVGAGRLSRKQPSSSSHPAPLAACTPRPLRALS